MKVSNLLFSGSMVCALQRPVDPKTETRRLAKPHWEAGDVLYVRETCRGEELPDGLDGVRFKADQAFVPIANTPAASIDWLKLHTYAKHSGRQVGPWVPAIHMPRWASRITLKVVEVQQELLIDISDRDCIAEGISRDEREELPGYRVEVFSYPGGPDEGFTSARRAYLHLWNSINGKKAPVSSSPTVWVTRFERAILWNVDTYLGSAGA